MVNQSPQEVIDRFTSLLNKLKPQQRKKLASSIAVKIASANRERIKKQQEPDGTPFITRKRWISRKTGKIKSGVMFKKLRTTKNLKRKATTEGAEIGFYGKTATIAQTHHFGARRKHKNITYVTPQRALLGVNKSDLSVIENEILKMLGE